MTVYPPDELIARWLQEKLTVEQAIGQLLLHLRALQSQVTDLQTQLTTIEHATRQVLNQEQPMRSGAKPKRRRKPKPPTPNP